MRILRITAVFGGVVVVTLAAAVFYLLAPATVPETSDYRIDRDGLERAASELPGELPIRVNHVKVGEAEMPRAALFSGFDFSPHRMVHGAYQVVYPDGSYALIDAAFGASVFEMLAARGNATYDADLFGDLKTALTRARVVAITHEHLDHIQGLAEVEPAAALAPRVFLNQAQHENPATADLVKGVNDEDELGISYHRADPILHWMVRGYSAADVVEMGFDADAVAVVQRRLNSTHWKRELPTVAVLSSSAIGEFYLRPVDY